jgi:hypothetical protein
MAECHARSERLGIGKAECPLLSKPFRIARAKCRPRPERLVAGKTITLVLDADLRILRMTKGLVSMRAIERDLRRAQKASEDT